MSVIFNYNNANNLANVYGEYFFKSNLFNGLYNGNLEKLDDYIFNDLIKSIDSFSNVECRYYTSLHSMNEDIIFDFAEEYLYLEIPIQFKIVISNIEYDLISQLDGQSLPSRQLFTGVKNFSPIIEYVDEHLNGDVLIEIGSKLLIQLKYQDKISNTFTSKANKYLSNIGV